MLIIKKLHNVYTVMNDGTILECYDTKHEARKGLYEFCQKDRSWIEDMDNKRKWKSMWDVEQERKAVGA